MPINTIIHNGTIYPYFQAEGNASQYIISFASKVCKGVGFDVGFSKPEWKLPGAIGIDQGIICDTDGILRSEEVDADHLPEQIVEYIFSSHCLEHVPNWINSLDHWNTRLSSGGVLFLYLPDYSQSYWRPWINRKHNHVLSPNVIQDYLIDRKYKNIFVSGVDLNNSFTIMAEKI